MEKVVVAKASEPSSGSATRGVKNAETDSPVFDLTPARADTWDQPPHVSPTSANNASAPPSPFHPVLRLQRSIGNRAVGNFLAARSASLIQRQCQSCVAGEEDDVVQRRASSTPTRSTSAEIIPASSHGEPLDDGTRGFMESRFDTDFSRVRVHTDAPAATAAENINATAFTTNQDIYFAPGKYAPEHGEGQRLLAHELAHTVQQSQGQGPTKLARKVDGVAIGDPDDPLEQQADVAADRALTASPEATPAPPPQPETDTTGTPAPAPAPENDEVQREKSESSPWWKETVAKIVTFVASVPAQPGEAQESKPTAAPSAKDEKKPESKADAKEKSSAPPAAPPSKDALPPTEEGEPKKPDVDATKVDAAVKKKGPGAPKAAKAEKPAPASTGDAAAATSAGGGAVTPEAAPVAGPAGAPEPEVAEAPQASIAEPELPLDTPQPEPIAAPETEAPEQPEPASAEQPEKPEAPESESETETAETPSPAAEAKPEEPTGPPPELPGLDAPPGPEAAEESAAPPPEPAPAPAAPETHEAQAPIAEAEVAEAETQVSEAETAQGSTPASEPPPENPQQAAPESTATEPTAVEAPGAPEPAGPDPSGGCNPSAADAPPTSADDAGPAAGPCGGGGSAIPDQPQPAVPDVAGADPAAAMSAVADLPPAQLQTALGGVSAAASKSVDAKKQDLAANPPQLERPSGVPAQRDPSIPVLPPGVPAPKDPKAVERTPAGAAIPVPQPVPLPAPPPPPIQSARTPKLVGEATVSADDAAKAQAAMDDLPTTDPALEVTAGDPPTVELEGDADPKRADEQRAKVDEGTQQSRSQGLEDVATPMGESDIYPTVPKEKLTARTDGEVADQGVAAGLASCVKSAVTGDSPGAAKDGGGKNGDGAATDEKTLSIVAQEKKGDEIKAAVMKGQGDMAAKQQENAEKIAKEKVDSQKDVDKLVEDNAAQQKKERTEARQESLKTRTEWNQEQGKLVEDADKDAADATKDARDKITVQQKDANEKAAKHIEDGNKEADDARKDAERKAAAEKKKSEESSGGFFDWVASKVSDFFDAIKSAIHAVFDAARKLVKAAIEGAKKLATAVIEGARKLVVAAIHAAGDILIAIGDRVLAAFPKLRDKFRKAIQDRVKAAETFVNKLADELKKDVQKALDMLGAAINAYLSILECAYTAVVDAVGSVVKGAIQFAKAVVQAFAVFGVLIKDISAGPGQWLSNLGDAVVSGLKNCFWNEFKTAVKNWFNSKVEEVLGLPVMIFQLLFKGCLKMADIGKMAWEALKAAIPTVLVQLLIEKLVAMIVPAAGAILTIIEGLRAAWGTVSRIIAAFELFFAFLKAVRSGNAAGKFAKALAAAAIVVIDFVANWLLQRLRKPAGAVAGRLRAIASKIGKALRKGFGVLKKGAKIAAGAIKRGVVAVGRGIKTGAVAVGRTIKKGAIAAGRTIKRGVTAVRSRVRAIGQGVAKVDLKKAIVHGVSATGKAIVRGAKRVGRAIADSKAGRFVKRGVAKAKAQVQKIRKAFHDRKTMTPDQRVERAQATLQRMLSVGVAPWTLPLRLAAIKVWYKLSSIEINDAGETVDITLIVNPKRVTRVKTTVKKLHNGRAKLIGFGTLPTSRGTLKVIRAAVEFYRDAVTFVSAEEDDPSTIGKRAGAIAERALRRWSLSQKGVSGVRVGTEFPSAGGVPLGKKRWYGKFSSDAKYARGSIILDFKLSEKAQRPEQHEVFVRFAVNNGYTIVYIYGSRTE